VAGGVGFDSSDNRLEIISPPVRAISLIIVTTRFCKINLYIGKLEFGVGTSSAAAAAFAAFFLI
jgi:hypothetical protein